jgi:hypothetical protein
MSPAASAASVLITDPLITLPTGASGVFDMKNGPSRGSSSLQKKQGTNSGFYLVGALAILIAPIAGAVNLVVWDVFHAATAADECLPWKFPVDTAH